MSVVAVLMSRISLPGLDCFSHRIGDKRVRSAHGSAWMKGVLTFISDGRVFKKNLFVDMNGNLFEEKSSGFCLFFK